MSENDELAQIHLQQNLFSLTKITCHALKDDRQSMEFPFFSISRLPDRMVRYWEEGDKWMKITPSIHGMCTIMDKDFMLFCASRVVASVNADSSTLPNIISFHVSDYLAFSRRKKGGKQYKTLLKSLERLRGVSITTNIKSPSDRREGHITQGFSFISEFAIHHNTSKTRVNYITVKLSDWILDQIPTGFLTINWDYFNLKSPVARRVYEVARKFCGQQPKWEIGLQKLQAKLDANSRLTDFRRQIKTLVQANDLPDYGIFYDPGRDVVIFRQRSSMAKKYETSDSESIKPVLTTRMVERLKTNSLFDDVDIYAVIDDWQQWIHTNQVDIRDPEAHFLAWSKNYE